MHWKGYNTYITEQAENGNYLPVLDEVIVNHLKEYGADSRGHIAQHVAECTGIPYKEVSHNLGSLLTRLEARGEIHKVLPRGHWEYGRAEQASYQGKIPTVRPVLVRSIFDRRSYRAFAFGVGNTFIVDVRGNPLNPVEFKVAGDHDMLHERVVDISPSACSDGTTVVRCVDDSAQSRDYELTFIYNAAIYRVMFDIAAAIDAGCDSRTLANLCGKLQALAEARMSARVLSFMMTYINAALAA